MLSPPRCVQNCERPSASTTSRPRRQCRLLFLLTASLLLLLLWSTASEDGTAQGFLSASRLAVPRRIPRRQQSSRLVRAASPESPEELYSMGMTYIDAGRDEGVKYVSEAAEAGNADAQCTLGTLFALGLHGVAQDPGRAEEWLQKAVDGGSVMANYNLGIYCITGQNGFTVDKKRAAQLFRVSAEAGHHESMMALALAFKNGDGVAQDSEASAKWVMKAAARDGGYEQMAREMQAGTLDPADAQAINEKIAAVRELEKVNPYLTKDDQGQKVVWGE